jgi:hypothetical protein
VLRHAAPEIDQTHGYRYIADVAAALRQAIEVRDEKQVKSYRRSLRSAMVRMKEVATRTVQSQKWDPSLVAEFMQDVDGSTSELLKSANATLMQLDQKTLTTWANNCAEQGRQVMQLAAEAYELLTPDIWTLEDCDEYMIELDEELKRLKDLFKLFSTDKLNLAMRRKAAKLTNNVNTEVTKARKIVQRLIAIHEAGVTSDEEQEEETSRSVMGNVSEPVNVSDASGRHVRLPQEAQTPRPRRSRSGKENDGEGRPHVPASTEDQLGPNGQNLQPTDWSSFPSGFQHATGSGEPFPPCHLPGRRIKHRPLLPQGRTRRRKGRSLGRSATRRWLGSSPRRRSKNVDKTRPPPPVLFWWGPGRSEAGVKCVA